MSTSSHRRPGAFVGRGHRWGTHPGWLAWLRCPALLGDDVCLTARGGCGSELTNDHRPTRAGGCFR